MLAYFSAYSLPRTHSRECARATLIEHENNGFASTQRRISCMHECAKRSVKVANLPRDPRTSARKRAAEHEPRESDITGTPVSESDDASAPRAITLMGDDSHFDAPRANSAARAEGAGRTKAPMRICRARAWRQIVGPLQAPADSTNGTQATAPTVRPTKSPFPNCAANQRRPRLRLVRQ